MFAIARIFWKRKYAPTKTKEINLVSAILMGAIVGLFSGLIGIGGGIILSPLILLLRWGNMKEAAAVSALFIWVNSASGLLGQFSTDVQLVPMSWFMVLVAVVGGLVGSYYGSKKWTSYNLELFLAFVLVTAAVKLILF